MRIAMIGTGYVGLVSGACFADFGHQVTCVDKDAAKIDALNAGRMPIWEPGLEGLVKANVERDRLRFTTDLAAGVEGADAVFIAVGTPARRGDGHADLTFVYAAVRELAKVDRQGRRWWSPNRPSRSAPATASSKSSPRKARRRVGRVQPRIPARGRGDPRLQAARPDRRRRRGRAAPARCCAKSTGRCSSTRRRSCSPAGAPPS